MKKRMVVLIKYTAHSQPAENVVYSTSVPANFYMYN